MADRIADNADLVIDEMKRKARRRLVGAIVLALAAAIILPMLLEKEPRPLGDDVSVQIPPVDDGKFVNRLTGRAGDSKPVPKPDDKVDSKNTASKSEPRSEPTVGAVSSAPIALPAASPVASPGGSSAPKKSIAEAEHQALSSTAKPAAKTESNPTPAADAIVEPQSSVADSRPATAESKSANAESKVATVESKPAKAESIPATVESKPAKAESIPAIAESKPATPEPKPGAAAPPLASSAAPPAKADGFVVQLAAFADDKGANALANKLKKVGYLAYVEPVSTSRGTLWRVRVGGYGSRPEADAARAKLKGEGFSGIVAPAT